MKEIKIIVPSNLTKDNVKPVIDELCKNGIAKGCYQDYSILMEVLQIFTQIEEELKEKK